MEKLKTKAKKVNPTLFKKDNKVALKPIDKEQVGKLAGFHCTNQEIASFFDCDRNTIERRFGALIEKKKDEGKCALRRLQWRLASEGNVAMLIWLGKQYLDQSDGANQRHSGDIKVKVVYGAEKGKDK